MIFTLAYIYTILEESTLLLCVCVCVCVCVFFTCKTCTIPCQLHAKAFRLVRCITGRIIFTMYNSTSQFHVSQILTLIFFMIHS
jgi:hypothetical protein